MEDFTPTDMALDYGYYQGHSEAWQLVVAAIGLLVVVTWLLNRQAKGSKSPTSQ